MRTSRFFKHLGQEKGVSLVQTLVASALAGGLALVIAQLSTQSSKNKMANDRSYAVMEVMGRIQYLVSNSQACAQTFIPSVLAEGGQREILNLRDSTGAVVFEKNRSYENGQVTIQNMTFQRGAGNSILSVVVEKNTNTNVPGAKHIKRDFFITGSWDASNQLLDCSSDIENFMDTVVSQSLQQACDNGSSLLKLSDDGTQCETLAQLKTDETLLRCGADESYLGLEWIESDQYYRPICGKSLGEIPQCGHGMALRRNQAGIFECVEVTCKPNEVSLGIDANGVAKCFSCPAGTLMVSVPPSAAAPHGWSCQQAACGGTGDQKYFVGFNTTGEAICNPIHNSAETCPNGAKLIIGASGEVSLECCVKQCGDQSRFCSGTHYEADNGCGTCVGTKPSDCSNASNYCIGTSNTSANGCGLCPGTKLPDCSDKVNYCSGVVYTSFNGCGTCTGTKGPVDATWSSWQPTSEYRPKAGSTCSKTCGGGYKPLQRKYVRSCNNDEACGGNTCMGVTEQWRDEGTEPCNTQACPVTRSRLITSNQTITLTNVIPGTLLVWAQGGGGGGGRGGSSNGGGGLQGTITLASSIPNGGNFNCSITIGGGGCGSKPSGCSSSESGTAGAATRIVCGSYSVYVAGGPGGARSSGGCDKGGCGAGFPRSSPSSPLRNAVYNTYGHLPSKVIWYTQGGAGGAHKSAGNPPPSDTYGGGGGGGSDQGKHSGAPGRPGIVYLEWKEQP